METVGGSLRAPMMFRTEFQGFSVQFSPYDGSRIACGTAQYFGVAGNGKQYVLQVDRSSGTLRKIRAFYTQDGIYDCCWSECNPNQLVSACGDGSLKLWDLTTRDDYPILNYKEHTKEASCVHWNQVSKDTFLSAGWDGSVKLWTFRQPKSLMTFLGHQNAVYGVSWSPHHPTVFASVSGDRTLKIWDAKTPNAAQSIAAHGHEILTVDWCKYQQNMVVTGSADKMLKVWDLRRTSMAVAVLGGHGLAVRRVKCSPHERGTLASASYDMSVRMWNYRQAHSSLLKRFDHHSEFVCGLDLNLFLPGEIATCAWDRTLVVWNVRGMAPLPLKRSAPALRRPVAMGDSKAP
eukprot:g2519.t1